MNQKLHIDEITAIPSFIPSVGEDIGADMGAKMVKNYFDVHPDDAYGHVIGRDILEKLLAQPGCAGLSIHPGYNDESNVRQLVFAAVDAEGQQILKYTIIGDNGKMEIKNALVVDHVVGVPGGGLNWFS
jgi:predicted alternative tryptophan synthase beta-subunit